MVGGGDFMKPDIFIFFKDYKKKYIGNDIMAGLLVAIIALPLSIAVGIQSMPEHISTNGVQIGIITAIVAGFLISFLGGGRFQIGGPTPVFVAIVFGYLSDPAIGLFRITSCYNFCRHMDDNSRHYKNRKDNKLHSSFYSCRVYNLRRNNDICRAVKRLVWFRFC